MLDFNKTDLIDDYLIIQNEDGSITCIPEKDSIPSQKELFDAFREAFPNGKSVTPVEPTIDTPIIDEEKVMLMESFLEQQDQIDLLTQAIIKLGGTV